MTQYFTPADSQKALANAATLDDVTNGNVGQTVTSPDGRQYPTIAEAIARIEQVTDNAELTAQQKFNAIDEIIDQTEAVADQLAASQQERIDAMVNAGLVGAGSTDLLVALSDGSGLSQAQFNAKLKLANIDYDKVVTVGTTGANFTTINAALTELSKYKPIYLPSTQFSNFKAKILIKSGFVVTEQINIIGIDFSWIDIASEDAEVVVNRAALTQKVGRWYSFIRCKNGAIPTIKTLFTMNTTGTATERVHLYMINAKGFIESKMPESPTVLGGFKNAGDRNVDLTQGSVLCCASAVFTGALGVSVRPATGSRIFMQYADVSYSGVGISVGTGASVAAEDVVATNCTDKAVQIQGGCVVDLTNANLQNCTGIAAIYSELPCLINADNANVSGATGYGIYAENGARVSAQNLKANNCAGVAAIRALYGGQVVGKNITATGNKIALYASRGGQIITDSATLTGSVTSAVTANEGGIVSATYSQCRNDNTTPADSANDARVLSGGTLYFYGSTGGVNQQTDVATAAGIIYRGATVRANGSATIAIGTTSIVVNHGLTGTPKVQVTPTNAMGSATKYWITSINSTSFTINVNQDPASTTATFAWDARL